MNDIKAQIGHRMLELRKSQHRSQAEVAAYLELTVAAYQNYEAGRREAGYTTLCKLAEFYKVSLDYLLGRDSKRPDPIEMLDAEEAEKRLLKAYFQLRPGLRAEFLQSIADALARQEGIEINAETYTAGEIEDFQAEEASAKDDAG